MLGGGTYKWNVLQQFTSYQCVHYKKDNSLLLPCLVSKLQRHSCWYLHWKYEEDIHIMNITDGLKSVSLRYGLRSKAIWKFERLEKRYLNSQGVDKLLLAFTDSSSFVRRSTHWPLYTILCWMMEWYANVGKKHVFFLNTCSSVSECKGVPLIVIDNANQLILVTDGLEVSTCKQID